MKKLGVLVALSTALIFSSFNIQASAATQTESNHIVKELNEFAEQTDNLEIISTDELPEGTPVLNFDSVEDFEKAVAEYEVIKETTNDEEVEEYFENLSVTTKAPAYSLMAATTSNGSARILWCTAERFDSVYKVWLPFSMWIDFTYTYTGSGSSKKFTKITKIVSNSSGFPSTWHQTTSISNFYDSNKGVSIKIQGYHLLGVAIGGQAVGAKFSDTYTKKYHF